MSLAVYGRPCFWLIAVVDELTVKLREMRKRKRELKEQLRKLTRDMELLKGRQSVMVTREVDSLRELDQAEALANAVPLMVPVSGDMVFDFSNMDPASFEDGAWDLLMQDAYDKLDPVVVY